MMHLGDEDDSVDRFGSIEPNFLENKNTKIIKKSEKFGSYDELSCDELKKNRLNKNISL